MNKFIRKNLAIVLALFFVCVSATSAFAVTYESEPNDEPGFVNVISVGEKVKGEMITYDDMYDYFVIKPKTSGTIKLTFTANSKNDYLGVAIMGWGDNDFGDFSDRDLYFQSSKKATVSFHITKGNEYFIVPWFTNNPPESVKASYTFSTKYVPGKTAIKKTTPGKKSFKVTWKKISNTSFYQIRYTSKSSYKANGWEKAKIVKAGKNSKSKTIKNLKKKKTYYVQVRTARKIDGKIYYSVWSKKKAVTVK